MRLLQAASPGGKPWIQFEFTKPETFQSVTLALGGRGGNTYADESTAGSQVLEISDDGIQFREIVELSKPYYYTQIAQSTTTFPPVSARFFRVVFTPRRPKPTDDDNSNSARQWKDPQLGIQLAELVLYNLARVNRFEDKAGFTAASDIYSMMTLSGPGHRGDQQR